MPKSGRVATARGTPSSSDLARQITVAISAVLAVVGASIGSGAFVGTPIAEAAGGALATDATLVAPASPAFSIWSVIYAGLVALAAVQLLPSRRTDGRQRRVGWLVALSMLLNAAWILSIQAGWLTFSVLVITALLATLVVVFVRLTRSRPSLWVEAVLLDGTMGLYLGWVAIATVANIAAALSAAGVTDLGLGANVWAVIVLAAAGAVGVGLAVAGRGRLAVAASLSWGLVWIAVARSSGDPASTSAAVTAVLAAAATMGSAALLRRHRTASTP
jgi:hypothetical protein